MEFYLRQVYPWMIELSSFSFIIPLLAGVFIIYKSSSLLYKLLLLYVGLIAVVEIISQLTVYLGTGNNHWINHLYTPMEAVVIGWMYYSNSNSTQYKRILCTAVLVVIASSIYNIVWGESLTQMDSMPHTISAMVLVSLAIIYFYQAAHTLKHTYLDRDPMFVLSCGIIIYQAGTAMAYSMFNEALATSYDTARICISVILVLNILFRIILAMAITRTVEA